jgi:hypothetical protein
MYTVASSIFRISAGHFGSIRLLSQPETSVAGRPLSPSTRIQLLDRFGNPLSCSFNECPTVEFGYPAQVSTRSWPVLPSSNMQATSDIVLPPGDTCGAKTARPECACIAGSRTVRANRGIADFGCLAVGGVGSNVRIALTVQGVSVITDPFKVIAGSIEGFEILQQPAASIVSGQYFEPPVALALMDRCGNPIREKEQDIDIFIEEPVIGGVKQDSGLVGLTTNRTVIGIVYFTRLRATRANKVAGAKELPPYRLQVVGVTTDKVTRLPTTLFTGLTASFQVINGPLQEIRVRTQPSGAVQGGILSQQPTLQLVDSYNNPVVDDSGSIVITASLVPGEGCVRQMCESYCDGTRWYGRCIKYFKEEYTFDEAANACQTWGGDEGYLVSIADPGTNEIVTIITGGDQAWMGLRGLGEPDSEELTGEYIWEWLDKSDRVNVMDRNAVFYNNWYASPLLVPSSYRCAGFNIDQAGLWGPSNCSLKLPYICSKPIPSGQDQLGLAVSSRCACCQRLLGTLSVNASGGIAAFTDLMTFSEPASGLRLHFIATR